MINRYSIHQTGEVSMLPYENWFTVQILHLKKFCLQCNNYSVITPRINDMIAEIFPVREYGT